MCCFDNYAINQSDRDQEILRLFDKGFGISYIAKIVNGAGLGYVSPYAVKNVIKKRKIRERIKYYHPELTLNTPLEVVGGIYIGNNLINPLLRNGVRTFGQVSDYTVEDFKLMKGVSDIKARAICHIIKYLKENKWNDSVREKLLNASSAF